MAETTLKIEGMDDATIDYGGPVQYWGGVALDWHRTDPLGAPQFEALVIDKPFSITINGAREEFARGGVVVRTTFPSSGYPSPHIAAFTREHFLGLYEYPDGHSACESCKRILPWDGMTSDGHDTDLCPECYEAMAKDWAEQQATAEAETNIREALQDENLTKARAKEEG